MYNVSKSRTRNRKPHPRNRRAVPIRNSEDFGPIQDRRDIRCTRCNTRLATIWPGDQRGAWDGFSYQFGNMRASYPTIGSPNYFTAKAMDLDCPRCKAHYHWNDPLNEVYYHLPRHEGDPTANPMAGVSRRW